MSFVIFLILIVVLGIWQTVEPQMKGASAGTQLGCMIVIGLAVFAVLSFFAAYGRAR